MKDIEKDTRQESESKCKEPMIQEIIKEMQHCDFEVLKKVYIFLVHIKP